MKKNNLSNKVMLISFFTLTTFFYACKKENRENNLVQVQQQQINQVLPQKYIDTLKNLGLTLHDGTNPPIINGIYILSPLKLKASNIPTDFIGKVFSDAKLKILNQNNTNFSLEILGKDFLASKDTSIISAISGEGNNFTLYGKIKANYGANYAIFALVISGTLDATKLKNVEYGLINIDNTNGNSSFISEGQTRIIYEVDSISENTTVFRLSNNTIINKTKPAGLF
jgi:hypothetical protein